MMGRVLLTGGGVLAGLLAVLVIRRSGFAADVRTYAALREHELRDALGLSEEVA